MFTNISRKIKGKTRKQIVLGVCTICSPQSAVGDFETCPPPPAGYTINIDGGPRKAKDQQIWPTGHDGLNDRYLGSPIRCTRLERKDSRTVEEKRQEAVRARSSSELLRDSRNDDDDGDRWHGKKYGSAWTVDE